MLKTPLSLEGGGGGEKNVLFSVGGGGGGGVNWLAPDLGTCSTLANYLQALSSSLPWKTK